jgi:hypothetical protein
MRHMGVHVMSLAANVFRLGDYAFDEDIDITGECVPDPLDVLLSREDAGDYLYHVDATFPNVR